MGLVVKDGELGSLCRPYRAPWSATGKPRAKALGYSLAPLRGSGGEWKQNDAPLVSQTCGRTSVRPYNPRKLRAYGPAWAMTGDSFRAPEGVLLARRLKPAALLELTKPLWELGQSPGR